MSSEEFKNHAQGTASVVSAVALVIAGGFAFYKFVWVEQNTAETELTALIGGTRA